MNKFHNVSEIEFLDNSLLAMIDGKKYSFPLSEISKRLESADELQRRTFEISISGYGIHWPLVDEDLSIEGLLKTANASGRELAR